MHANLLFAFVSAGLITLAATQATVNIDGFDANTICSGTPTDLALLNNPQKGNCEDFIEVLHSMKLQGGGAGCKVEIFGTAQCGAGTLVTTIPVDEAAFGDCVAIPKPGAFSAMLVGC